MTVEVETGIIMQHLEWELEKYRCLNHASILHPFTAQRLGGFIAHRGTGVLSTKYGKIEDMIGFNGSCIAKRRNNEDATCSKNCKRCWI